MADSRELLYRILLATDGTVTTVLEAYADEAVQAVTLAQSAQPSRPPEAALLAVPAGSTVLDRKILLCGVQSGTTFLYGESLIVLERLDRSITDGLASTSKPIGTLLRENRLETFREILTVGQERAGPLGTYFDSGETATLLFRSYRILARGKPIMLITEKFPASRYR